MMKSSSQKSTAPSANNDANDVVGQLGTILMVWAHPDDETYCGGGIMRVARRNGQRVYCITATRGEAGSQDPKKWPLDNLGEVRTRELQAALRELSINEHEWLGCRDGGCRSDDRRMIDRIVELIREIKPDSILTFGPDGLTGHSDHKAVSKWVEAAVSGSERKPAIYHSVIAQRAYETLFREADQHLNVFFATKTPPIYAEQECDLVVELDNESVSDKINALRAMPSQTEKLFTIVNREQLEHGLAVECFRLADQER